MKLPKNKTNLYIVVRHYANNTSIIGGFSDWEAADNFREACQQEWKDLGATEKDVQFDVELTTYYAG